MLNSVCEKDGGDEEDGEDDDQLPLLQERLSGSTSGEFTVSCSRSSSFPWVVLPADCLFDAMQFLPTLTCLQRVAQVCRAWRQVACCNGFWSAPLHRLQEGYHLQAPRGAPVVEAAQAWAAAVDACGRRGGVVQCGEDMWAIDSYCAFVRRFKEGRLQVRTIAAARSLCCFVVAGVLDKLAGPFVLVTFAVTIVFGTIPYLGWREFQHCAWTTVLGESRSTSRPPATGGPELDWLIQQATLAPLVGWRLTSWSRSPSLILTGSLLRCVHVLLAVAPVTLLAAKALRVYYSFALVGLHVAVLLECYAVVVASRSEHPDWHSQKYAPWHEHCPGVTSIEVTAYRAVAVHCAVVAMQDLVLLVWTFHLDTGLLPLPLAVSPYWILTLVALLGCVFICSLITSELWRGRCPCFLGVVYMFLSLGISLSALTIPIPLAEDGSPC